MAVVLEATSAIRIQPPTSPVRLDDDEEEVVPDSPPQNLKRKKNKGKAAETVVETKGDSKPKARPWTKVEEEALAMAEQQNGCWFWKAITDKFNAIMEQGPMRDVDSVSGKWRKMSKIINRFCDIYNLYYINPPSGSNEDDILNLALAKWDEKNKTHFEHIRAWKVLKKENKWKPIPNEVATAKRRKTSESGSYSAGGSTARCHIDINDEPEFDEEEFAVHESERPPGRDKAKKEAAGKRKAGGSNHTSSGAGSKMDESISEFRSFKELTAEKICL
ncbi:glutathione S-transferase T3-like [Helianthus annuus]|uniref:glutathione S-transferase T3-like n=1 Tax=Helianthus annuus TaxID=4232 RepID=UPI000B8FF3DC|nr:glutathione S-transferase T3-like [Helianthus annuus]